MKLFEDNVAILQAIVLACLSACESTPGVTTPPATKSEPVLNPSERIVFVSDRETSPCRQIYIMRTDGSGRTRITHDLNDYVNPVFSPDGATIMACTNTIDFSNEIYAMNVDGSGLRNLSHSPGDDDAASFSPDGSRIVFTSSRDGNSEIYVMNADGTGQVRLTFSERFDYAPRFTPNGSKILYCSATIDPGGTFSYKMDICEMNTDGSNTRSLSDDASLHAYAPALSRESPFRLANHSPAFSKDGAKVLFTSYDNTSDNNRVMIMNSDGGNLRIVFGGDLIFDPVFAPGDSMIIFTSHRDGKFDLFEMALDGTRQRKLTRGTPGHVCFSDFSSDGTTIAFSTDVGSAMAGNYQTVWTMDRTGSVQTQLTFGGANDLFPHFQQGRK